MSDHQTLDIYRIKFLTGSMMGPTAAADYETLATLAIQFGFDSEAQNVIQKGMASKLLTGDRDNRLLSRAKQDLATDLANLGKTVQAANADEERRSRWLSSAKTIAAWAATRTRSTPSRPVSRRAPAIRTMHKSVWARPFTAPVRRMRRSGLSPRRQVTPNGEMIAHLWALYVRGH